MNYSNEIKVGLAVVVTAFIFFAGIRFFEDMPIFRGDFDVYSLFEDADGLTAGSTVRVNGVSVGTVGSVAIDPETMLVRVEYAVDTGIALPQGTQATISGISALGSVNLDLVLGAPSNPPLEEGARIPVQDGGLLSSLADRAPELVNQIDSTLGNASATLESANTLLANPQSDLRTTMTAIRGSAQSLDALLRSEQARLARTLENIASLSAQLETFTTENSDSLGQAVSNLNVVLAQLNQNLATLDQTTRTLDSVLLKLDQGSGTLGLMLNDPSLYTKLDSAATALNVILADFQSDPRRYLRELRLIDLF